MSDDEAKRECEQFGLHPRLHPLGDGHHTDEPLTVGDKAVGGCLAYFMGTLFADVDDEHSRYWYYERTSENEWARVVRALRVHGLHITDLPSETDEPSQQQASVEPETGD